MRKQALTKEESDMLSEAMSPEGTVQERQVRTFDFAHPDKLSKANLRALELVFADLEKSWIGTLSTALKSEAVVQVKPFEQAAFGGYAESVSDQSLVLAIPMSPLPGKTLIDIPAALALPIMDRLTGGKGEYQGEPRPLTRIEQSVVAGFIGRLASDIARAFHPVAKLETGMPEVYSSVAEITLDQQSPMVVLTTEWDILSIKQPVNVAIPVHSLDPMLEDLIPQRWRKTDERPAEARPASIAGLLQAVEVPATVKLGRAGVSMQEVLSMEVGDVIRLEATVNDPIEMEIGGQLRFQAKPGLVGKRLAVQIVNQAETSAQEEPIAKAA